MFSDIKESSLNDGTSDCEESGAKFVDDYSDLKELGVDDADWDPLTSVFHKAANHASRALDNLEGSVLLQLYGYYKQATVGPNTTREPSWYEMRAKHKWQAWSKLQDMSQDTAKTSYIRMVKEIDPNFDDNHKSAKPEAAHWVKMSAPLKKDIIADSDKTIGDHIKDGNLAVLESYLREVDSKAINELDGNGMALIHWAADGGLDGVLRMLLEMGAEVDVLDNDGQTSLHYAASCGHVDCVKLLLGGGARVDIVDNEGNTPLSVAMDDSIKDLLTSFKL